MQNQQIQIHLAQERVTYFFLCFRYLSFQSCCRFCVLHEHLTHGSSLGCGESSVRQTRCPLSGQPAKLTTPSFAPSHTQKPVRIPHCHLLRKIRALGASCQSLLAVKSTTKRIFINSFTLTDGYVYFIKKKKYLCSFIKCCTSYNLQKTDHVMRYLLKICTISGEPIHFIK